MNSSVHVANPRVSKDVTYPRERTRATAARLSLLATRHWERALAGVVAVPAAAALTTASALLFALSILERSFGLLDTALADVGEGEGAAWSHGANDPTDGSRAPSAAAPSQGVASAATHRTHAQASSPAARRTSAPMGASPVIPSPATTASERASSASSASAPTARGLTAEGQQVQAGASEPVHATHAARAARHAVEDTWDVILLEAGDDPIGLIRLLRERTGGQLRDLENVVGRVPETVRSDLGRAEAEALRELIEGAGGRVEVRLGARL